MQIQVFISCLLPLVMCGSIPTGGEHTDKKHETASKTDHVAPAEDTHTRCRCVPDQWQGVLESTDREYDLNEGRSAMALNKMKVFYDYKNKMFAMTDLITGSLAIADYKRGMKYVSRGGICHGIATGETMKQMCLPDGALFVGQFTLGSSVPVDLWNYNGPFNTTMKTSVLHDDCVPVTEEISMHREGYVSVTSSMYLDVKLGPIPKEVFSPPAHCTIQHYGPSRSGDNYKRSTELNHRDLWNALRQRLYIFN